MPLLFLSCSISLETQTISDIKTEIDRSSRPRLRDLIDAQSAWVHEANVGKRNPNSR